MKNSNQVPELDVLREKLELSNSIPNINCGGCAINALAIKRFIEHNFPKLNPVIVYSAGWSSNERAVEKGNGEDLSCSHAVVMISVDDNIMYADSEGIGDHSFYRDGYLEIPEEMVVDNIKNIYVWNDWFDRKTGVKKIGEIFGVDIATEIGMSA